MTQATKILIVDDKAENILALASLVEGPDVEIVKATSGNEALEMLLKHDVGLALLDVQMPIISGLELARLMRSASRTRTIPIIFVTASQMTAANIFDGYEHGAVDYLTKPLSAPVVRSKVRVFVELDQKSRALAKKTVDLEQKSQTLEQKLREVEALRCEAEAASRAKSRFVANMSHEIRTPLGAVLGFSELLKIEDQTEADRQNCIIAIERNGKLLLKLIDDVLDLSKIEADRVEVERGNLPLAELISDISAVHSLKALDKGIEFAVNLTGALPRFIVSDPIRLKQILNNIIGNAVKFTDKGRVIVEITLLTEHGGAANKDRHLLSFSVTDTGCGLSESEVEAERLFQPFMQADSSTKRRYGGSGLGLTISKRLARLLGGDAVLVSSAKGVGSRFVVTIDPGPISEVCLVPAEELMTAPAAKDESAAEGAKPLLGKYVLVVDDARDNRMLMSRFLQHAGATVDMAEHGAEAVTKANATFFDVILMDIQMPVMDGYEATDTLRKQGYKRAIIALTAHAMREELARCVALGCDHSLSKPIRRATLIDAVYRYANLGKGGPREILRLVGGSGTNPA